MSSSALSAKLSRVLSLGESAELLEAVDYAGAVSAAAGDAPHTAQSRAQLRTRLEARAIANLREFLASYDSLRDALDAVDADAAALSRDAAAAAAAASAAERDAAPLLAQAENLRGDRAFARACAALAAAFDARYRLTPAEHAALTAAAAAPLNDAFLAALCRAQAIREDARGLLSTSYHRAGVATMSDMSALIEDALWRLSAWVRAAIAASVQPQQSQQQQSQQDLLRRALQALQPSELYRPCLEELAVQRGKVVAQAFIAALTVGGRLQQPSQQQPLSPQRGRSGRPIEIHAHDPLRYVGDMLAWIHQTVASEFELVSSLLQPLAKEGEEANGAGDGAKPQGDVRFVLEREFEGLCRPLKVRLEQALSAGPPGPSVLFRLCGVLAFYANVIGDLLGGGADAALPATVRTAGVAAMDALNGQLRTAVGRVVDAPPTPPADLSPPPQVRDFAQLLADLVSASSSGSVLPSEDAKAQLSPALVLVIGPLASALSASAAAAKLDATSSSVLLVNSLSSIAVALGTDPPEPAAEAALMEVHSRIAEGIDALVADQAARFLNECGIAQRLAIAHHRAGAEPGPLSSVLGLDTRSVEAAARGFEAALLDVGAGALLPAHVDRLLNPRYRAQARAAIAARVADSYTELYNLVVSDTGGYPDHGSHIFRYKPDQARVLLDV